MLRQFVTDIRSISIISTPWRRRSMPVLAHGIEGVGCNLGCKDQGSVSRV